MRRNRRADKSVGQSVGDLPTRKPVTVEEKPPVKTDDRGMVRQIIYMPPDVYDAVRTVAHDMYMSQQAVWRRAMSDFLSEKAGVGTWDELDKRPQKDRGRERE